MYKAKQRMKTLLLACFAALVSMLLAVALWVAPTNKIDASAATTVTDVLNRATTGVTGTNYGSWSDKKDKSTAVYAGQSAGGNDSIQLRSKNNNSGIITTASGGKVAKISVEWNSKTTSGRILQIYGKNTAYTAASELYNVNTQGTKLGEIKYGTSTELTVSGDYQYVGMKSSDGAMYLTSISIEWTTSSEPDTPTCEHTNTKTTTVDATCTAAGSITVTCDDCGETVSTTEIPATGHQEILNEEDSVAPTCTTPGKNVYTCSVCSNVREEEIPVSDHNYVDGTCSSCGKEQPTEETLTFDNTSKRTEFSTTKQVWSENGITLTNNKGTGNNIADYSNPVRFYQNSELIVDCSSMTKIEFTCNSSTYATALKNSIGDAATVEGEVVTVEFAPTVDSFTVAKLTAQVRMDSIRVFAIASGDATCQHVDKLTAVPAIPATCTGNGNLAYWKCECGAFFLDETAENPTTLPATVLEATGHNYTNESIIKEATCTELGRKTLTCSNENCNVAKTEDIPTLPHDYVNGKCSVCDAKQPIMATITFDDTSKRTEYSTEKQVWKENEITVTNNKASSTTNVGDYSNPVRFYKNSTVTIEWSGIKVIVLNSTSDAEYLTALKNSLTGVPFTQSDSVFTIVLDESVNSYTFTCAGQVRLNSISVYSKEANIDSARITIGEDITMNYYVTMPDAFAEAKMYFTVDGKTYEANGIKGEDGRYVFSLKIPPHFMANNISATLIYNENPLASKAVYSVKEYAQNQLNNIADGKQADANGTLKQLLTDLLYYGDAAYNYFYEKTNETPATSGVENLGAASTATPDATDFTLVKNEGITSYPAYFLGAGVYFDNVNKIYVKLNTTENVTLKIRTLKLGNVEVEITGTTVYTNGILATDFGETYTFELYHDGVLMQTLTYSVNAYAHAKQDDATMGELALALYRYGASATAYKA